MDFFNRLIWIFSSPKRVFEDVKEGRTSWWQPWVFVSLIYMVAGYFAIPIQRAVLEFNPGNLTPEQLENQLVWFERFGTLQLLATPIVFLVLGLIVAGIGYILVSILSEKANFKKFFTVYFYSGIIATLTTVFNVLIVRMKGIDTLRTAEDASFSIGLGFLGTDEGLVLKSLFSSIEFFGIWSLIVLAMGLTHVFEMPRKHAVYCVIPLWVIGVILLMLNNIGIGG